MRRGRTYKARDTGAPPTPPRPDAVQSEPSVVPPPPSSTVKEEAVKFTDEMRRTMAERLTDAEAQIYNGWAALADNDGYRLNTMELRGMTDSYDMLLQYYGPELGPKMLAIIMFSAAHVTPMLCRILVKPRKGSTERANKMVANATPKAPTPIRPDVKPVKDELPPEPRGKVERKAPVETEDEDEGYDGGEED